MKPLNHTHGCAQAVRGDCVSRSMVDVAPLPDHSALVRVTVCPASFLSYDDTLQLD